MSSIHWNGRGGDRRHGPPYVRTLGEPPGGFLLAWGRHPGSGWWGFVSWTDRMHLEGRHTLVACAAWVAADRLRPQYGVDYTEVRRLPLPADPADWPVLDHVTGERPGHYYGRIAGEPQTAPDVPGG